MAVDLPGEGDVRVVEVVEADFGPGQSEELGHTGTGEGRNGEQRPERLQGRRFASETFGRSEGSIRVVAFMPVKLSRRAANL